MAAHAKLFIIFLLSFPASLALKWLMLASCYGHKCHTWFLCVCASIPLIAIKRCCLRVSLTLRICVHCRTPFYITPPFSVTPTFTSDDRARNSFATAWLSFSVELAGHAGWWPSSYRYWLCRVQLTALLSHYPCKIVDLIRLHNGY